MENALSIDPMMIDFKDVWAKTLLLIKTKMACVIAN